MSCQHQLMTDHSQRLSVGTEMAWWQITVGRAFVISLCGCSHLTLTVFFPLPKFGFYCQGREAAASENPKCPKYLYRNCNSQVLCKWSAPVLFAGVGFDYLNYYPTMWHLFQNMPSSIITQQNMVIFTTWGTFKMLLWTQTHWEYLYHSMW